MRQGQQNRRGRGRNRKSQNPLSRNFESNGPDVKIRGSAAHIADKYMSLARDAMAAGDNVVAENYLQHAEHYNRIIMAAQAQLQQPFDPMGGGMRPRSPEEGGGQDQDGDYDDDDPMAGRDSFQPQQGMREPHHGGHRDDRRHRFDRRHEGGQRPVPGMDDQPDIRANQGVAPASGEAPTALESERVPRPQNAEGGFRRDRQDEGGNFRGGRRRGRHQGNGNGMNGERRNEGEPRERFTPPKDEEPIQS